MNTLQPVESELGLLGSIFLDNSVVDKVSNTLKPRDFVIPEHQRIFLTSMKLRGSNSEVCPLSVAEAYDGPIEDLGGFEYLTKIDQAVGTAKAFQFYHDRIKPASRLRGMEKTLRECLALIAGSSLDDASQTLGQVSSQVFDSCVETDGGSLKSITDATSESMDRVKRACESPGGLTGVTTGISSIDKQTTGFHPGELSVIAARPGMGKTTLALNMATSAAKAGHLVVVFSLEMPTIDLANKIVCSEASVNTRAARTGTLSVNQIERMVNSTRMIKGLPLWIYDRPGATVGQIHSITRQCEAVSSRKVGLILIDYLQLMTSKAKNRQEEVSEISRGLKGLSKTLNCPIVALAQLNRGVESREDKRPLLSDLRESGAIEQDADDVSMIFRPGYYEDADDSGEPAEFIIRKSRQGIPGTVKLGCDLAHSKFTDWEEPEFKNFNGGYREH